VKIPITNYKSIKSYGASFGNYDNACFQERQHCVHTHLFPRRDSFINPFVQQLNATRNPKDSLHKLIIHRKRIQRPPSKLLRNKLQFKWRLQSLKPES
jgi:hypothetical protein